MASNDYIGNKGREHLREFLTAEASNIPAAIETFQQQNAILVPSLKSALGLYDLFGMPRLNYYAAATEALREKFVDHLTHLQPSQDSIEKLNDYLLRYSHLATDVPVLQPVIYSAAMTVPSLSDEVIEKFTEPVFFEACPSELRQKIYEQRPAFFKKTVFRLTASYINSVESTFRASAAGRSSKLSPDIVNILRKHDSIQSVSALVGHNKQLYASVHSIFDEIFEETENDIVCSMKSSVILFLAGASETLRQTDPFYKLCWCLDNCVRSQNIESKQLKHLQVVCESVKDIGSLAILLADPLFVDLACKKLISLNAEAVTSETLLRNNSSAQFLVYLLKLGHHNLLVKKNFRGFQDLVDAAGATYFDFLSALATLSIDVRIAAHDSSSSSENESEAEKPAEAFVIKKAQDDILCWLLLMHHCQANPSTISADSLVVCLPDDGLTDSVLFELLWTLGPMLQNRPSFFLDSISALLSKISSSNDASELICAYTIRLFDLGISLLENTLVQQLPAIIECIKTTVTSLTDIGDSEKQQLLSFFDNAATTYDV